MELEKAIKNLKKQLEKVTEERDIYKEEHYKITKLLNLKEGSLNPPVELVIESLKKALENSIPKKKIENEIEILKAQCGGNVFHIQQTLNAEIRLLQELLEGK